MLRVPSKDTDIDEFIKDRLSLIEIGLRNAFDRIEGYKKSLEQNDPYVSLLTSSYASRISAYDVGAQELNTRLSGARYPLHYHNGFIQIQRDEITSAEIEQPFWSLVSEPLWENVDLDMKEALDQRDAGGKDPALYAAKALESTIKIISDVLSVSHGNEKGAHNFIENLAKKGVVFLNEWESEFVKGYFSRVRNPLGHGPGKAPMPTLNAEQTTWAIETAMSWIKLLVERYNDIKTRSVAP